MYEKKELDLTYKSIVLGSQLWEKTAEYLVYNYIF